MPDEVHVVMCTTPGCENANEPLSVIANGLQVMCGGRLADRQPCGAILQPPADPTTPLAYILGCAALNVPFPPAPAG